MGDSPTKEQVRTAREAARLTQTEAGKLVHVALRTWQDYEKGNTKMHPGLWELFNLKVGRFLMNPDTGSVDTEAQWRSEMPSWETNGEGLTPAQQFKTLIEVQPDRDGSWIDVK